MTCEDFEPEEDVVAKTYDTPEFYCDGCGDALVAKERSEGLYRIEPCVACRDIWKDTERHRVQQEIEETLDALATDTARLKRENEYFLSRIQNLEKEVETKNRELVFAWHTPTQRIFSYWEAWLKRRKARKGVQS